MMKVVGEEGTSLTDFYDYLKSEFLDTVYLQQNAFSDVDASTPAERQKIMFDVVEKAMLSDYSFKEKDEARKFFMSLQQEFIDWNNVKSDDPDFIASRDALIKRIEEVASV
jgi:V/A-type H+-transporting ATPase subunit A